MTDERFAYIEDVKNRKRSSGKKGKSRYGCSLPSDNLGTREKRKMNGILVVSQMDRPMRLDKFLSFGTDFQENYLQNLIDNHGGCTSSIAKMFGCEESEVKRLRRDLKITSAVAWDTDTSAKKWENFLHNGDYLREPMTWDEFKTLDRFDQQAYLNYIMGDLGASTTALGIDLFGHASNGAIRSYAMDHGLNIVFHSRGYRMSKEQQEQWIKFLNKRSFTEEVVEMKKETPVVTEPPKREEIADTYTPAPRLPSMRLSFTVKTFEEIEALIKTLPKAEKGTLTFIFGEED